MKPAYITTVGTTPKQYDLDTNMVPFLVQIRPASGVTVQGSLEKLQDSQQPNSYFPPVTTQAPVWETLPAAVNGIITLTTPYASLLFTPTTGGICTVLQQGVR